MSYPFILLLHLTPLQWKFSQNDATEAQSNAVDINAFFTRILNSLSLVHSPSLSRSLFSLAPFLYIYFPKLTQSAFISCLLGYIFAFSLPFLPIHYCIPSTLPLHIPFYRSCLPAMPWGLESCRMRCRWGKINWSIATHNERRRKSIQRMNHPPPPPPTILFSRSSGTGERTVMCCVRLYEVLWGRKGKCLCRIRFFTVPDKTCILQGKKIIPSWPRRERRRWNVRWWSSVQ